MASHFHVLSQRNGVQADYLAICCVFEMEDAIANSLNAQLTQVDKIQQLQLTLDQRSPQDQHYLFLSAISIYDIAAQIARLGAHAKKFDKIYAYVFDAFLNDWDKKFPNWKKKISPYYKNLRLISKLFVPFQQSVNEFKAVYSVPVGYLPLAADVFAHGGFLSDKKIDINGYGRQPMGLSQQLSTVFNERLSEKIYHHTDHAKTEKAHDFYAHRRAFWQFLRNSKIGLAFDGKAVDPSGRFPFSFVGQRWFEMAAAGCVIVGKRPTCAEMSELFPDAQSTIELPDAEDNWLPFLQSLLADQARLETVGKMNYAYALEHHDWRHRLRDLLNEEKIDLPEKLQADLQVLAGRRAELNL